MFVFSGRWGGGVCVEGEVGGIKKYDIHVVTFIYMHVYGVIQLQFLFCAWIVRFVYVFRT